MKSTNESKFEGAEIGGGMEQTDVVKTNPDVVVEQIKEAAQSVPDPKSEGGTVFQLQALQEQFQK